MNSKQKEYRLPKSSNDIQGMIAFERKYYKSLNEYCYLITLKKELDFSLLHHIFVDKKVIETPEKFKGDVFRLIVEDYEKSVNK